MQAMNEILRLFPNLSPQQQAQLAALDELYRTWNERINLISRKDIDNLYPHHVLHSMAIAKLISFRAGTRILDFGTGGGFPGIPLAILFPDCQFTLIDGTGKKIMVATEVAKAIGLQNVTALHRRGEDERGLYEFVVSRAVMPLPQIERIVRKNISKRQLNSLPNGIICLKGGNVEAEIQPYRHLAEVSNIAQWFTDEWFKEKRIIYLPV